MKLISVFMFAIFANVSWAVVCMEIPGTQISAAQMNTIADNFVTTNLAQGQRGASERASNLYQYLTPTEQTTCGGSTALIEVFLTTNVGTGNANTESARACRAILEGEDYRNRVRQRFIADYGSLKYVAACNGVTADYYDGAAWNNYYNLNCTMNGVFPANPVSAYLQANNSADVLNNTNWATKPNYIASVANNQTTANFMRDKINVFQNTTNTAVLIQHRTNGDWDDKQGGTPTKIGMVTSSCAEAYVGNSITCDGIANSLNSSSSTIAAERNSAIVTQNTLNGSHIGRGCYTHARVQGYAAGAASPGAHSAIGDSSIRNFVGLNNPAGLDLSTPDAVNQQ